MRLTWRAWEICANIKGGEIVIFDKAYIDYEHLKELDEGGGILGKQGKGEHRL